jgi:poly(A) polymerase
VQKRKYHASEHEIDHHLIDSDALQVIAELRNAGYEAYLVGGSVRDLLAKKTPKDFDISTSARPEDIKKVFQRRCMLIGRRFRLAHVRFGNKIFEVATFRSGENDSALITRDNQWGTPEEDVMRRDFTINGLFYDPATHTVIDYVGGWDDIHKGILRCIGTPTTRFKQDPVRMLRLLKFKARFGFSISKDCQEALISCKNEIMKSSPARLLEEIFRMLESGASSNFFKLMMEAGILELLFPALTHFIRGKGGYEIFRFLEYADSVNRQLIKKPIDRNVLACCLLFPILEKEIQDQHLNKGQVPHIGDVIVITGGIIKAFVTSSFTHLPRRMTALIGYILSTQYRFTPFSGKRHHRPKLFHQKEFLFALQFFKLRSMVKPSIKDIYNEWEGLYRQYTTSRRGHHTAPHKKRVVADAKKSAH